MIVPMVLMKGMVITVAWCNNMCSTSPVIPTQEAQLHVGDGRYEASARVPPNLFVKLDTRHVHNIVKNTVLISFHDNGTYYDGPEPERVFSNTLYATPTHRVRHRLRRRIQVLESLVQCEHLHVDDVKVLTPEAP